MTDTQSFYGNGPAAPRLGANHGYRIAGDVACLNAELAVAKEKGAADREWALQLWACERPYGGGALRGVKIAEAALEPQQLAAAQPQQLYAETSARLPPGNRDYAMVLVLASGRAGTFDHVDDFANYPARERFIGPELVGDIGYELEVDHVTLRVERVRNARAADNLSGTLALELWLLPDAYAGGQFAGWPLAGVELGTLAGQASFERIERRLPFTAPRANGPLHVVLMLREWTQTGYVTRDFRTFATSYEPYVAQPVLTPQLRPELAAPQPEVAQAQPAAAEAVVAQAQPAAAEAVVAQAQPVVAKPAVASGKAASAVAVPGAAASAPKNAGAESSAPQALVSIQTASLAELCAVKGLNRKLAQEIIKARPYRSFDELKRVRGIGDKTLRSLRSVLTL